MKPESTDEQMSLLHAHQLLHRQRSRQQWIRDYLEAAASGRQLHTTNDNDTSTALNNTSSYRDRRDQFLMNINRLVPSDIQDEQEPSQQSSIRTRSVSDSFLNHHSASYNYNNELHQEESRQPRRHSTVDIINEALRIMSEVEDQVISNSILQSHNADSDNVDDKPQSSEQ